MNVLAQTEEILKTEIKTAIIQADLATEEELPTIALEKPKDKQHGDFASNIAMQLARIAKKAPRQIAEEIVANLDQTKASIQKVDIAGPGFRSEEHTSELQSRGHLVCRLLLEKKNKQVMAQRRYK